MLAGHADVRHDVGACCGHLLEWQHLDFRVCFDRSEPSSGQVIVARNREIPDNQADLGFFFEGARSGCVPCPFLSPCSFSDGDGLTEVTKDNRAMFNMFDIGPTKEFIEY